MKSNIKSATIWVLAILLLVWGGSMLNRQAERNERKGDEGAIVGGRGPSASGPIDAPSLVWAVAPEYAGDNLPPVGRSLFDFLVADAAGGGHSYNVPFPFDALTRKLEGRLGCTSRAARRPPSATPDESCVKQVLIPLGRSLQRTAAAPEFFKFPRVVAAVDGEPRLQGEGPAMLLKDRLYLGYQEQANLIEVISYNESAARFEFQLVKDYRPGGEPKVFYANRAICVACHQNHAPIFSRQVWEETNANPQIAALLAAARKDFYGIPVARGVDIPNAIDKAIARANLFSVSQKLWREGCEDATDQVRSIRCRAALFMAVLQSRLSGERGAERSAPGYRQYLLPVLGETVAQRWRGGLAIPDPDIPNRDPLRAIPADIMQTGGLPLAHVPARFEPVNPREPLEIWPADAPAYADRGVTGLGRFLAADDIRRLDEHLFALGSQPGKPRRTWSGECRLSFSDASATQRYLDFRCPAADGADAALRMAGRIALPVGRPITGTTTTLRIEGGDETGEFDLRASRIDRRSDESVLVAGVSRNGEHVRLTDGRAIESITLRWRGPVPDSRPSQAPSAVIAAQAVLSALDDFAPVAAAIAELAAQSERAQNERAQNERAQNERTESERTESDVFSAKPFRRAALMPALFSRLGVRSAEWCCSDDEGMAPARMEGDPLDAYHMRTAGESTAGITRFYRYCATCHETRERFPPNFLYGDAEQVETNLRQCAERIFFRLNMWAFAPGERVKTPMPPALALHRLNLAPDKWIGGADLAELAREAAQRVQSKTGMKPDMASLLAHNYESLPACLPPQDNQSAAATTH